MRFKQRAFRLAVTAGMVGSLTVVAAPAANAFGVYPDFCGVYLQGSVDPTGGLIPAGLIPFPGTGNQTGQKAYALLGHEAKGQDKILNDLNNTSNNVPIYAHSRFQMGIRIGGLITATTVSVADAVWTATDGGTITYTTAAPHGRLVGDIVSISNSETVDGFNQTNVPVAAVIDPSTFTVIGVADPGAVYISGALESLTAPISPVLGNVADSTSWVKIKWANDRNGLGPKPAEVEVGEQDPVSQPAIARGYVTAVGCT